MLRKFYMHQNKLTCADKEVVSLDAPNGRIFTGGGYAYKLRNTVDRSALLQIRHTSNRILNFRTTQIQECTYAP